MLRAAAAATAALALLTLAPVADAGRARVRPAKTTAQLRAEHAAALPGVGKDTIRHELGLSRAFDAQDTLGPVRGRGVFEGKSKATGRRKVTHLELMVGQGGDAGELASDGMRIKSQDIDGDVDETPIERFFKPVAGGSRMAIRHLSTDGLASFLLIVGRGIFDYHGGDFEGDPEPGFGPPAPTPTPAP